MNKPSNYGLRSANKGWTLLLRVLGTIVFLGGTAACGVASQESSLSDGTEGENASPDEGALDDVASSSGALRGEGFSGSRSFPPVRIVPTEGSRGRGLGRRGGVPAPLYEDRPSSGRQNGPLDDVPWGPKN